MMKYFDRSWISTAAASLLLLAIGLALGMAFRFWALPEIEQELALVEKAGRAAAERPAPEPGAAKSPITRAR